MCALAGPVAADRVHLKNGNILDGVIRAETATEYQVDVGFGTVGVQKAQVAQVERSTEAERHRWAAEQRQRFILHEKYAPAGQRDLVAALQALEVQHAGAMQALRRRTELQQALERESQELPQVRAQEASLAGQLTMPAAPTQEAMELYNRNVAQVNELRVRILELQQKPAERLAAMDQCRREVARYLTDLLAFAQRVQQRKQRGAGADDPQVVAEFFAEVDARLKPYLGEVAQIQLPCAPDKQRIVVKARLNNQVEGNFVVDTGATDMCITEALAQRLNLALVPTTTTLTLADGSTRQARAGLLDSVEVKGARVANVVAVVLPVNSETGIDGLLGMSFLMEFNIQLDPVTHTLVLNRLAPP